MYLPANPLTKFFFWSCGSQCSWPIILRICLSVISQERSVIDIKILYRKILLFWCGWPDMPKVPKVTRFQNLGKKEIRHKFSFLHEDKNQIFLEADTMVFSGHNQACPKYPKQHVLVTFLQLLLNPWLIVEMWPA